MNEEDLSLAADFPPVRREDWLRLVTAALKGGSFETLTAKTDDDLRIEPLYARDAHARPVAARALGAPWQVAQRVDHPDASAANAEALHDLENGATGLALVFAGGIGAYGYGLAGSDVARALDGVVLDAVSLELDLGPYAKEAAEHVAALVKSRGVAPGAVDIRFGFDPLGAMAASGASLLGWRELAPRLAGIIGDLVVRGFNGPFAVADGRPVHAAGGSEAQELAFVLAVAVAYLRALERDGIALDDARRMIFFRLAADADQFLNLAKFRALRILWARVEDACGLASGRAFISAETAWRMMTRRDPWVNMLRATMAVFAAGLGGADSITVLPFTAALGLPDRFARRMARNTQLILLEESNLAKVSDPAAGSGAIGDLTAQLCRAAWALFQEIEAADGVVAALENGFVQDKVAKVRAARQERIAHRIEPLTGTSAFPDIKEAPVSVLDVAPVPGPAIGRAAITVAPLARIRLAEPFEQLRDASDRMLAAAGARPRIFLANLGRPSHFTARATFAKNFFEAGGIEAATNDGFADIEAMVTAFTASGATLACLCSSDETYARQAVDAAKALRAAGARHVYLAGRLNETYKAGGVQSFIYAGCDALAMLRAAHDILSVAHAPQPASPELRG
jgi:methylmalonyl-CoA mutase